MAETPTSRMKKALITTVISHLEKTGFKRKTQTFSRYALSLYRVTNTHVQHVYIQFSSNNTQFIIQLSVNPISGYGDVDIATLNVDQILFIGNFSSSCNLGPGDALAQHWWVYETMSGIDFAARPDLYTFLGSDGSQFRQLAENVLNLMTDKLEQLFITLESR